MTADYNPRSYAKILITSTHLPIAYAAPSTISKYPRINAPGIAVKMIPAIIKLLITINKSIFFIL